MGITNVDKRLKAIKLTLSSMKNITMSDAWRYSTDERDDKIRSLEREHLLVYIQNMNEGLKPP